MKLNKKQVFVLCISLTLLVPLLFTLYVRIKDYKKTIAYMNIERETFALANARSKNYADDRETDKFLEQLNKLGDKREIDKRKVVYALLTIFCLISFTSLGVVFLKEPISYKRT